MINMSKKNREFIIKELQCALKHTKSLRTKGIPFRIKMKLLDNIVVDIMAVIVQLDK